MFCNEDRFEGLTVNRFTGLRTTYNESKCDCVMSLALCLNGNNRRNGDRDVLLQNTSASGHNRHAVLAHKVLAHYGCRVVCAVLHGCFSRMFLVKLYTAKLYIIMNKIRIYLSFDYIFRIMLVKLCRICNCTRGCLLYTRCKIRTILNNVSRYL